MKKLWVAIGVIAQGFLNTNSTCSKMLDKTDSRKIQLVNTSTQTIIFYQSTAFAASWPGNMENYQKLGDEMKTLSPNSSLPYSTSLPWEEYIEAYAIKKLPVFVVNKDSVVRYVGSTNPWPHTMSDVGKSWLLNMDSLQIYNWTLSYP